MGIRRACEGRRGADGVDYRLIAAGWLEASECPDVGSQSLGKRGHTYWEA